MARRRYFHCELCDTDQCGALGELLQYGLPRDEYESENDYLEAEEELYAGAFVCHHDTGPCPVCGMKFHFEDEEGNAPCPGVPVVEASGLSNAVVCSALLAQFGTPASIKRCNVVVVESGYVDLYPLREAAPGALPAERRGMVLSLVQDRHCRRCFSHMEDWRPGGAGPWICMSCSRTPTFSCMLRELSALRLDALADYEVFGELPALMQLIECEMTAWLRQAEVAQTEADLDVVASGNPNGMEASRRQALALQMRWSGIPAEVERVREWLAGRGFPRVDEADDELVSEALGQALGCFRRQDPFPSGPRWYERVHPYLVWLLGWASRRSGGEGERRPQLEADLNALCEKLALLAWYTDAPQDEDRRWLTVPRANWWLRDITHIGRSP